ncbi:MAG: hypothetical protein RDV41_12310 [Planctomycetota bacterium]|nr:hypothetical protein [Planctomycetota bacterium]
MRNVGMLFVVLAMALFAVGCGEEKKTPTPGAAETGKPAQPAGTTTPSATETVKPPQPTGTTTTTAPAAGVETAALDLEAAGLPLVIDAPKGATAKDDFGAVLVAKGAGFQIEFHEGDCDIAGRKKEIEENTINKLKKFHTETADTLLYESEVMGKAEFHFLTLVKVGDKTCYAEDVKGPVYTKADVESMLKSAQSARAK